MAKKPDLGIYDKAEPHKEGIKSTVETAIEIAKASAKSDLERERDILRNCASHIAAKYGDLFDNVDGNLEPKIRTRLSDLDAESQRLCISLHAIDIIMQPVLPTHDPNTGQPIFGHEGDAAALQRSIRHFKSMIYPLFQMQKKYSSLQKDYTTYEYQEFEGAMKEIRDRNGSLYANDELADLRHGLVLATRMANPLSHKEIIGLDDLSLSVVFSAHRPQTENDCYVEVALEGAESFSLVREILNEETVFSTEGATARDICRFPDIKIIDAKLTPAIFHGERIAEILTESLDASFNFEIVCRPYRLESDKEIVAPQIKSIFRYSNGRKGIGGYEVIQATARYLDAGGSVIHTVLSEKRIDNSLPGEGTQVEYDVQIEKKLSREVLASISSAQVVFIWKRHPDDAKPFTIIPIVTSPPPKPDTPPEFD